MAVITSPGKRVEIWDADSLRLVNSLAETKRSYIATYSPDGKWLVTAHGVSTPPARGEVIVWDTRTMAQMHKIVLKYAPLSIAFSPDSKLFAMGLLNLESYDVKSGRLAKQFPVPHRLEDVAFSPKGDVIATVGGTTVRLWALP